MRNAKTDCFAYSQSGCNALNRYDCQNCSTYKTWEQCHEEQKKCKVRAEANGYIFRWNLPEAMLKQYGYKE